MTSTGTCSAAELTAGGAQCHKSQNPTAFATCPDDFCAAANQVNGCAGAAQVLGCYSTGGSVVGGPYDNASCIPAGSTSPDCSATGSPRCEQSGSVWYCVDTSGSGSSCTGGSWIRYDCWNDFSGTNCGQHATAVANSSSFITPYCGTQQIDCTINQYFSGRVDRTGCGTNGQSTTPPPSPSSPPGGGGGQSSPPGTPVCQNIQLFDTSWNPITNTQLSSLTVGSTVRLAVTGTNPAGGTFTKARFTINGVQGPEITTTNPTNNQEFYTDYQIPSGVTSFTFGGELYSTLDNAWH